MVHYRDEKDCNAYRYIFVELKCMSRANTELDISLTLSSHRAQNKELKTGLPTVHHGKNTSTTERHVAVYSK